MSPTSLAPFSKQYIDDAISILGNLDIDAIEKMATILADLRDRGGRLFLIGVRGGARHAGHAVNDFRKITKIEAYSPSDNVSELTARTNDEGWETTYSAWLEVSKLRASDLLLVFSVGGGNLEHNISPNIVRAVEYAKSLGAGVIGIVGRDGGYTASVADACVIVPIVNSDYITPHTESFQALVWHLLVSHPKLMAARNKWESSV